MKKFQRSAAFFILFIFQWMVARPQLSKDFIAMLPDSIRPKPVWKVPLNIAEKIIILKQINIIVHRQFATTFDSLATSLESDEVSANTGDKINILGELASYYKKLQMLEKSVQYCNATLQLVKGKSGYLSTTSEYTMLKGSMLSSLGRYEESILFLYGALEDAKANNDSIGIANVFSGLSYPYLALQLPETALQYLDSSVAYFGKTDFSKKANAKMAPYFSAMLQNYYLACLLQYEQTGNPGYISKMHHIVTLLTGQQIISPIPKTFPVLQAYAEKSFDSTIGIANALLSQPITKDYFSNQYKTWILQKYKALSLYNTQQKEQAVLLLENCIDSIQNYVKATGSFMGFGRYYTDNIAQFLYAYYNDRENWRKAIYYLSLHKQIEDTLGILSNRGKVFEVSQKYQYAKKELAVTQLQNENLYRKKQAVIATAITAVSLLSVVIIGLLLRNNNRKLKRKRQEIEQDARNKIERLNFTSQLQIADLEEKNRLIKVEEKKRLGRELHDGLAGDLAGIRLKLELETSITIDALQQARLNEIVVLVNEAYKITRDKSHDWYTSAEYRMERSFVERVETIINNGLPANMFTTEIIIDNDSLQNIPLQTRIELLYIIKEAIINILKHSRADKIQVLIYKDFSGSVLYIADNGKGFDVQKGTSGIGLKSMKERVESINGQLEIKSGEAGTELSVIYAA